MANYNQVLTDLIFILLQFFFIPLAYSLLNKNIFQPAVLFSTIWFGIILLHFVMKFTVLDELESLSVNTYVIFLVGTLFFILGSFLSNQSTIKLLEGNASVLYDLSLQTRIIFFTIVLIGLPFYIKASFQVFLLSQAENFFMGLRNELSNNEVDIGPVKYLMPLCYVVYAFNLIAYFKSRNTLNKILLYASFVIVSTYAVLATGRTFFFMILTLYLGISALLNKQFSIKKIAIIVSVFLILFMTVGIIYGKGGNLESSSEDNTKSAVQNLGIYMVTSLNALEYESHNHTEATRNGDNTLRFFFKIGMQLGILTPRKIIELKQEFVFVPYATNVYTYYSPYIRDFGKIYAWLMLLFFGGVHTWLFYKAIFTKSIRATIYYSFMLFPLLLSFFGDLYVTLLSFWLQLIFFTEIGLLLNRISSKINISVLYHNKRKESNHC